MPQNSFLLPDKMRIHRFIALAVAMAFVRVIECNVIDNSVIERLTKQSVTSINYLGEAGQKSHLTNAIHFVKQQSNKFDAINENIAKNVIMFLGDGMSVPVLAATRVYMGGEKESLSFEKFPFVAMSKTYCVNAMIADSACSATGTAQFSERKMHFIVMLSYLQSFLFFSLFIWSERKRENHWREC